MNYIWCLMIIVSIVVSIFNGTVDQTINGAFEGAKSAVFTVLSFAGVMCFWTGIMKIAENAGLSQKLEKLLKPIINFLFPNAGQNAKKYIAVNMSANILGMGNAATPLGIKAMKELAKCSKDGSATNSMCMLAVVNSASIQLIPSTLIAVRSSLGSRAPTEIIVPIWITSAVVFASGVICAKIAEGRL